MRRRALIQFEPTRADLFVAQAIAARVTPALERALRMATWAADEKVLLFIIAALWVSSRAGPVGRQRQAADHLLACGTASAVLPHVVKRVVDRKRPDRVVVHGLRHGVGRSGDAWDSFPSGHALHLGALAAATTRLASSPARSVIWFLAAMFASTRLLLLAHWATDVVAGLGLGVGLERLIARLSRAMDRQRACG
jgi:membrane-associated phospholipid phosphatase